MEFKIEQTIFNKKIYIFIKNNSDLLYFNVFDHLNKKNYDVLINFDKFVKDVKRFNNISDNISKKQLFDAFEECFNLRTLTHVEFDYFDNNDFDELKILFHTTIMNNKAKRDIKIEVILSKINNEINNNNANVITNTNQESTYELETKLKQLENENEKLISYLNSIETPIVTYKLISHYKTNEREMKYQQCVCAKINSTEIIVNELNYNYNELIKSTKCEALHVNYKIIEKMHNLKNIKLVIPIEDFDMSQLKSNTLTKLKIKFINISNEIKYDCIHLLHNFKINLSNMPNLESFKLKCDFNSKFSDICINNLINSLKTENHNIKQIEINNLSDENKLNLTTCCNENNIELNTN